MAIWRRILSVAVPLPWWRQTGWGGNGRALPFRRWAIKLVNDRAAEERGLWGGPTALDVPPQRADLAHLLNYRTHRHRLYGEQEGICAGSIPMCSGCNRSKGGKTMAEWLAVLSLRWSMG